MLKKVHYKSIALSTILAISATNIVSPTVIFASGVEQSGTESKALSVNPDNMKNNLETAGIFAQAMNAFSYMLLNNPDVNFDGLDLGRDLAGHVDLPKQILQDQQKARAHAMTWDTKVKRQLLDTLTGIIGFDKTFEEYYQYLVEAIKTGNKELLKEGIGDLQTSVQENKQFTVSLIQALTALRNDIGADARVFQTHQETLSSILKSKSGGIEADEAAMKEILDSINHYKQVQSDGYKVIAWPAICTWLSGGIMLITAKVNLDNLEPAYAQLSQTVDQKRTVNRVVGVAFNSVNQMQDSISNAVQALTYMKTQWDDLDSQYAGVLRDIDKADEKATANKFTFLKPILDTAKTDWKTLKTDADTLKEGLKKLKLEPISTKK